MIPEIDIWRIATLMLKCYGNEADIESAIRTEELAEAGNHNGAAVWRRVIDAIAQLERRYLADDCTNWTMPQRRRPRYKG